MNVYKSPFNKGGLRGILKIKTVSLGIFAKVLLKTVKLGLSLEKR